MKKVGLIICGIFLLSILMNSNTEFVVSAQSIQTIEISEFGQFNTSGWAVNVQVQNDIAYVVDTMSGLSIINVVDPQNPTLIHQYNEDIDELHQMYVEGNLVYLADYRNGFKILNVTDTENPTVEGYFDDGGEVGAFEIIDDLAFVVDFVDGLEILNISDPTMPVEEFQYDTDFNYLYGIAINNDLAYASDFISATESKIKILNISDLSSINEIAEYSIAGEPFSIKFDADIAYAMCSYGGMKIFNISTPFSLPELGSHYDGGNAIQLDFYEGYAVIADGDDGLEIINIADITNPVEVASYDDGGSAAGLHIVDDLFYVANGEKGLEILRIEISAGSTTSPDLTGIILIVGLIGFVVVIAIFIKMRKN